ncbi:MAG TPA: AraC family transcriptional regulator [Candidatus Limnocylindrales bacterium]|nr:AraC family transcriptional regulator [Candidatus Limnocylindrales bacterium]
MIKRPESLPDRPATAANDPLSDVLRSIHFTRALYYTVDAAGPWPAIQVPPGVELAPGLGAHTRTVLSYHVIVAGGCWTGLEAPDGGGALRPVALERGDVVVYPRGDAYFLTQDLATPPAGTADAGAIRGLLAGVADGSIPASFSRGPADAERTTFVCGFLGTDAPPFNPLLEALPRMLVVRQATGRLGRLVELALAEVEGAGSASVRERLSESMFIETVRSHLALGAPGWIDGLGDPIVGRALSLIHSAPTEPWTTASLAREAGASRSTFAERFSRLVGQPPMRYLAGWRMRLAADRLSQAEATVAEAAHDAGYESEAAFSRAFKKATGVTPGAWRNSHRARAGER